ncbi:hypothetical protein CHS0354_005067 [Potamilus streckersoni]|uniref:Uncharacterized protein n=1 Tax=Potamilus streckersoni TaxID=2493646 RepID=A0AAE0SH66_9BIVA|nr:hypothetical protein CHS0354_005067 [Potamilus streckersoni]
MQRKYNFKHVLLSAYIFVNTVFGAPPTGKVPASECKSLVDLCIVIDGSDSITADDYDMLRDAVANLIPELDIAPDKARVGYVVFSSELNDTVPMNGDSDYLIKMARLLHHPRDGTNTAKGIKKMREFFQADGRPGVPWLGIVITDGISKNPLETKEQADYAKAEGVSMFAVGVTNLINKNELNAIASTPRQVLMLQSFSQLKDELINLMKKVCPCDFPPQFSNAMVLDGARTIGSVREYICQPGYTAVGNTTMVCRENSTWSPLNFKCLNCGPPPMRKNAYIDLNGNNMIGSVRNYKCEENYLTVGNTKIECMPDGTWTMPYMECKVCGSCPMVSHASVLDGPYLLGTKRSYQCNPGYALVGNPDIECGPTAEWGLPRFECVPCSTPVTIANADVIVDSYLTGGTATYQCQHGYLGIGNPRIQCENNAVWSSTDFKCTTCGPCPTITNAYILDGPYLIGTDREYQCATGFGLVGSAYITCQPDGTWTKPNLQCKACDTTCPSVKNAKVDDGSNLLGTVRKYECLPGYTMVGTGQTKCRDDFTWETPAFECKACGDCPAKPHALVYAGTSLIGSKRNYYCEDGYAAFGSSEIVCKADATWSECDFSCKICEVPPVIEHAQCNVASFMVGGTATYQCAPGYLGVGNPTITCDKASWGMTDFKCTMCGPCPTIENAVVVDGPFLIGTQREYRCAPGYGMTGPAHITCMPDGTWSKPAFQCKVCASTCPSVQNSRVLDGSNLLGSVRKYECLNGYRMVGDGTTTCRDDFTWSPPTFKCLDCGECPAKPHALVHPGSNLIGSKRNYYCENGYAAIGSSETVCQPEGTWSECDFSCGTCGPCPVFPHALVDDGADLVDTARSYKCEPGYALFGNNPKTICGKDAKWSQPSFECRACSGTCPKVPNAGVLDGGNLLGVQRTYKCNDGYALFGTPTTTCQVNAEWSKPAFECRDCGECPRMESAVVNNGLSLLGTSRSYNCLPGYAMVGENNIVCNPDATWSQPKFICKACGKPPAVPNAELLEDGTWLDTMLIGTVRSYKCKPGYVLEGRSEIQCVDGAKWSEPKFRCYDCGQPPQVSNAYVSLGGTTVGSTREYSCNVNFIASGSTKIKCQANGLWETPSFTCYATTTTATTIVPSKEPSLCDQCRMINGVGYNRHPYDCNQYIQCYFGPNGRIEPVYRKCPFGQFWNQDILTCDRSELVNCPQDKCKDPTVKFYKYNDPNNCCGYWECSSGKATAKCCGKGLSFHPTFGCYANPSCTDMCPSQDITPGCDTRPLWGAPTKYEQYVGAGRWVAMDCAPGTAYNPSDCMCSLHSAIVPKYVCKPEVYINFNGDTNDKSGKNVHIINENVQIIWEGSNGRGKFDGNSSRLIIPRFSNADFGGDLVIKMKYKEYIQSSKDKGLQAMMTNGDCGDDPSIVIAKVPGYVLLGTKTTQSKSFAMATLTTKIWRDVVFIHDEKKLEGRVCGASLNEWSLGKIQSTHCGIQIGHGSGLQNFKGELDDIYIYQCKPFEDLLNIGY